MDSIRMVGSATLCQDSSLMKTMGIAELIVSGVILVAFSDVDSKPLGSYG